LGAKDGGYGENRDAILPVHCMSVMHRPDFRPP
jgi:hypothetical protein